MTNKFEMLKRFAFIMFGSGIALMGEHLVSKGEITFEIIGHETYGILLIVFSYICFGLIKIREALDVKKE